VYAKPFLASNPPGSVVILALLFIVIQYTLLELWLVPELAKVWKEIGACPTPACCPATAPDHCPATTPMCAEVNGSSIDGTLNDISDRLSDVGAPRRAARGSPLPVR